jgi:hypothetical protein
MFENRMLVRRKYEIQRDGVTNILEKMEQLGVP